MTVKVAVLRRQGESLAILAIGGIIYFLLCGPSITQRGFPPLPPIWWAMTFVWVFPLLFSCWFDSWSFRSRIYHLCLYAVGTGLIDAATAVIMVPKSIDPFTVLIETVVFYGPVHVAVTFAIEALVQGTLGRWRRFYREDEFDGYQSRSPSFSLLGAFYFFTVLCITVGFPFAFDSFVTSSKRSWARQKAESDWREGAAYVYGEPEEIYVGDARVEYEVDRQLGLRIRRQFVTDVYAEAYNHRITELSNARVHSGRNLDNIPSPQQLFALLDSTDLQEVTTFPHDVTPEIVVFRKGTITRWGSTATSSSDALSIATRNRIHGVGNGAQRVLVGPIPGYQDLVAIRNGTTWVGIFEKDGSQIASVSRFP
jgi:hypothetical protein